MAVKSPLSIHGAVPTLPAEVQHKAAMWAASETLAHLPDADPEFQREVLRKLLYALGIVDRPEPELPAEVAS